MQRRRFLQATIASAASVLVPRLADAGADDSSSPKPTPSRLRILVLGGTTFVGPAVVNRALARGHEVTLFNRGITRPYLFPKVEKLRGNRSSTNSNLSALGKRRRWDAVIDTWPEHAHLVAETASLLAQRTDYYYFVSSIAVYRDFSEPGLREAAAIRANESGYGGEKFAAEQAVLDILGERAGIARCHSIFGRFDPGSSLHYWLRRFAEGDPVLAPGSGRDPLQFVDVRDVAAWIISCTETRRSGVYNLAGPSEPFTFKEFLETCQKVVGSGARPTWVAADFLRSNGIRSFDQMPLWAPLDEDPGFFQISSNKAIREGMRFHKPADTLTDAWYWYQSHFLQGHHVSKQRLGDQWRAT